MNVKENNLGCDNGEGGREGRLAGGIQGKQNTANMIWKKVEVKDERN